MRRLGEGGCDRIGVAVVIIERDVCGRLVMQKRRPRTGGRLRPYHCGQRIDLDANGLGRVFPLQQRLGDDEGDRIADEANLVGRQCRSRRRLHGRSVAVAERHDALEGAVSGEVGAGVHAEHAGHPACGRSVDALDDAMGNATAHDDRMGFAGERDVIGVAARPAHQYRIFGARNGLADAEFHHGQAVGIVRKMHALE
jgi:hypothetical protein